jgi:hypothetical protein
MRFVLSLAILALAATSAAAATYYVATTGSDANPGTSNAPFATPQKAVTLSTNVAGDLIYVRGGIYNLSTQVKPAKAGAAGNYSRLWAFPGEQPVFDFSTMATTDKALDVRKDYWHVKGIEVRKAPSNGIFVGGAGVIIEGCIVHDCDNDGVILGSTSLRCTNALILNCDSYRNFQPSSGGNNGDGFAAKDGCGPGNVFQGCRAWDNSDDAWDFYNNNQSVALIDCWAMTSGYDRWGVGAGFDGNGNGFKLGGAGTTGRHHLTNCIALGNRVKGFDHNNGTAGQTMVNCTGYSNAVNFSFYDPPVVGANLLINCAAFTGTPTNLDPTSIQVSNSWQLATVTAADFASLDATLAYLPRNADYTLQTNAFLRLVSSSDLLDRGQNVGLPFNGAAPDLGAFEFSTVAPPQGAIMISLPLLTNGGIQFTTSNLSAHGNIIVHASTNLSHWQPIFTNPPVSGAWQFTDSNSAVNPQRFYRAEEK